ncbi:MAG: DNA cytosine methyltransferase [Acidimicrobiia bacterium]|nr:DNA cytosine methyltransferase [Acidimicrobiia bacterium]MYC57157.1 DNA cytosine methyltransferase [Acidimicrobiia bacterium]MYG93916.1 DNA cytosine methyltransferase [Acidimicrobiia bacterium]
MSKLKVMDLFCGIGGFSKGFENTGAFRVGYGVDLLPVAVKTFRMNHPKAVAFAADIRSIRLTAVADQTGLSSGESIVIVGGPPCQGFSSIRPFRSTHDDDPRNTLFEEFASYVNYFRPPVFVMENVVGLATHKKGSTIEQIQACFDSLGYSSDWRIMNAAHFGVPQKRERLVLIGAQSGVKIVFPSPTHVGQFKTIGVKNRSRHLLPPSSNNEPSLFMDDEKPKLPDALTVMEAIGDLPPVAAGESVSDYELLPQNDYQLARRRNAIRLDWHVATDHTKHMLNIISHAGSNITAIPQNLISSGFSSSYSRLDPDSPAVTLTVNFVHPASNKCIHPFQNRALTVREGARLQSLDDDFRFAGSRTQIAKQIGNAVPPLLGQAIAESVIDMLSGSS